MSNIILKFVTHKPYNRHVLLRHCRYSSGNVAVKEVPVESDKSNESTQQALQKSEKLGQMYAKTFQKKPQRPPYVKNMFMGIFDTELLAYPEALDKDGVERLNNELQPVQYFYDNLGTSPINKKEFTEAARQLKLFGKQAGQLQGGRELNITETCRFNEIISQRTSDVQLLNSEQCGVQALLKFGSEKQILKYLDGIINGKITMGLCISEKNGCDPSAFETNATFDANKKSWILNGKKCNVINGDSADLLLVLAKNKFSPTELNVSAFLVERTFGGVTSKVDKTMGLTGTDIATVEFENTHIPEENLLADDNKGLNLYAKLLPEINLMHSVTCSAISRQAINQFIDYCKEISSQENNVVETELINEKLATYSANLYAMESLVYLTAGLLDIYENQDCELEAAISKCFSAESTMNTTSNIMQFFGSHAYKTDHWSNILHQDAMSYVLINDSLDNMKIIIALQGLRHAGIELQQLITKIRNPFHHTAEILKRVWTQRKHISDNPSLTLHLNHYLHPSAQAGAQWLEYSVLRLQYATELMLAHYGNDIISKHVDLRRLGECAIDIYAMAASLARASRSYCIGLSHGEYEILLANAFCLQAMQRVKERVRHINDGPFITNMASYKKIGEKTFHVRKYFPEHPLTRNF